MRKVLSLAVSILTVLWLTPALSAQINSISDNGPVGKIREIPEATYSLGQTYKNPFDPAQIDVTALFTSPSGLIHQVKGFIYQDFTRTGGLQSEILTPSGPLVWKARFAPDETGTWSYSLQATDASGTTRPPARSFTVTASSNKGFVRVSAKDPDYFAFDNGDSYFPLGENMGWGGGGRTFNYDKWLTALSAAGGNYIRLWQAPWSTEIEWAYSYDAATKLPGDYSDRLKEAWELDYILDLCAQKKVYALLCLINHGKFSTTTNPNWDKEPLQ